MNATKKWAPWVIVILLAIVVVTAIWIPGWAIPAGEAVKTASEACLPDGEQDEIQNGSICDDGEWRKLTTEERLEIAEAELAELKSSGQITTTAVTTTTVPLTPTLAKTSANANTPKSATVMANTVQVTDPTEFVFEISGVRDTVPMAEVDYAKGIFEAQWPALSHVLAEPGKLMVGADFPQLTIDNSGGAIWRIDPGNQYRLTNNDKTLVGCAEGSFVQLATQEATLDFETGERIVFRAPSGSNVHLITRCPNADGTKGQDDSDLGDIWISEYKPNHVLVTHFSGNPVGGFVSEEGELLALGISQNAESCGSEGCLTTYLIGFDINTGAYTVSLWDGVTMETLETNWYEDTP